MKLRNSSADKMAQLREQLDSVLSEDASIKEVAQLIVKGLTEHKQAAVDAMVKATNELPKDQRAKVAEELQSIATQIKTTQVNEGLLNEGIWNFIKNMTSAAAFLIAAAFSAVLALVGSAAMLVAFKGFAILSVIVAVITFGVFAFLTIVMGYGAAVSARRPLDESGVPGGNRTHVSGLRARR